MLLQWRRTAAGQLEGYVFQKAGVIILDDRMMYQIILAAIIMYM